MNLVLHFDGDISIQTMNQQSGLFIGDRNNAVGWSAHGKTNSIFGAIAGNSNILFRNFNFLNDPDNIDTPIDDRDIHIISEEQGNENLLKVSMESINVSTMNQNSNLFIGKGNLTGIDGNQKQNKAYGSTYGNRNQSIHNINYLSDPDMIDGNIQDQDIKIANIQNKD